MKPLTRRAFLGSAALGAAAAGVAFTGCAPTKQEEAELPTSGEQTETMSAELAEKPWSFEIPPEPIAEDQIESTVEADVVVVGCGQSGLCTALSALEAGAGDVIIITLGEVPTSRGGSNFAVYSRLMEEKGYERHDMSKFLKKEISRYGYTIDFAKWAKWYNNSEEAMNWLMDKMDKANVQTVLEMPYNDAEGTFQDPVGSHSFVNEEFTKAGQGQALCVNALAEQFVDEGGQIFWNTSACQLIRENENTGRVTAVIAQGEIDKKYTKFVGRKAIVLASGDFSADSEMMAKYCRNVLDFLGDNSDKDISDGLNYGGLYEGIGQKMGLWVGAAWQKAYPNACMIQGGVGTKDQVAGCHHGLVVNNRGVRCYNEDVPGSYAGAVQMQQPDMQVFCIWDTEYATTGQPFHIFGDTVDSEGIPAEAMIETWNNAAEQGETLTAAGIPTITVKGDTVEEVIEQLGLPLEETLKTVERYNEFCANGVDEDFGKRAGCLWPIKTGPFYGALSNKPNFLTVMGGLRTDVNCHVCDADDNPIEGLYNVGTMIGDIFSPTYNFLLPGHSYGLCTTYGKLTGEYIAENE